MPQLKKLHAQEKDERQQKQQLGQLLQDADDDELQPKKAVVLDEVEALSDVLVVQGEDAPHQNDAPAALEEEDVDKLPNPSFLQFFILTNCKLSLVQQRQ